MTPIKFLFTVLFLSCSLSLKSLPLLFHGKNNERICEQRKRSCTSQTLCKPQAFTEKTTIISHQIFICSVISFFASFSKITFTFMWWEKQGKVYVGTLKAAATSKSGVVHFPSRPQAICNWLLPTGFFYLCACA